jgi:DNA-binding LacI/PurR family transcriptional regulator
LEDEERGRGEYKTPEQGAATSVWCAASPGPPSSNRNPLIGLIVTTFDDSYSSKLISSIESASEERGLIILKQLFGIPEKEEKVIKELLEFGVDGMIIYPAQADHYSSEILKMIVNKFPFILIFRSFKGVAATTISTDNVHARR